MKRATMFWGVIILLIGVLLLLTNLDILPGSMWGYFWPLLLIAAGLFVLFGREWFRPKPGEMDTESLALPLGTASQADIRLKHGAGELTIASGASPANVLEGEFCPGVEHIQEMKAEALKVKLETHSIFWFPPMWAQGHSWTVRLNPAVPTCLKLECGANKTELDLTDLKITELELETGASANRIRLPANAGFTRVDIDGGAASFEIKVPEGVAAHIKLDGGAAGFDIDTARFHQIGGYYESPDYATAANRVEIKVDVGAGSVKVI